MRIFKKIHPVFLLTLILLAFFGEHLIPLNGEFIGGIDVRDQFWWNAQFIKEQFLFGSIPLWNPYYYSGHPFVANPSSGIMYPTTLLFVFLPLPWAFNLDTIFHIFLAAAGMYLFVKLLTKSEWAGLVSAIIFALNGYFMNRISAGHFPLVHAAALLPWVFYFIEKAYQEKKGYPFVLSGMVLGFQILSGDPQINLYTSIFLSIYLFLRFFFTPRSSRTLSFIRFLSCYLIIPLIAFCVSAVQILPSFEFMTLSERSRNSYEFATFMSFSPSHFFTFLLPQPNPKMINPNWEFGCYTGILSVILACTGCLFNVKNRQIWIFAVMMLIAVSIMLGHYTPIYNLYYKYIPLISTFRVPARSVLIFNFILAVLAGFGAYSLFTSTLSKKKVYIVTCIIISLFFGLLFIAQHFHLPFLSKQMLIAMGMTLYGLMVLFTVYSGQKNGVVVGIVLLGLFADAYLVNSPLIPTLKENELNKKYPFEDVFVKNTGRYRVNLPTIASRGMKHHYFGINGYTSIVIADYFKFIYYMAKVPEPGLIRHQFAEDIFLKEKVFSSKILGVKYAMGIGDAGYQMFIADDTKVMPRASLIRKAVFLPEIEKHLQQIIRDDFDPRKKVLIAEREDLFPEADKASVNDSIKIRDSVEITDYSANRIKLKSISNGFSFLVLSELYYPGWYAFVDGESVPIVKADYLLRSIPLDSGEHTIEFIYRPMSFWGGAVFSFVTLGFIALFAFQRKKR